EGRRFKILLKLRDRNRIGDDCDPQRLRTVLVPTPAVPAASDYDHEQEHEQEGEPLVNASRAGYSREPRGSRPGELAEQKCEEAFKHKRIGCCDEYGARSEVLSTIYKKLRHPLVAGVGDPGPGSVALKIA